MSYRVRTLQTVDLPSVTEIYTAACRARESTQGTRPWSVGEMKKFLFESHPSFASYVCVHKESVIGWTALTRYLVREDVWETAEMSLYVKPEFRKMGIGTDLAQTLLARAVTLNLHCVFAIVFKDMPNVISFAERQCGCSIVGRLPKVFSDSKTHYDLLVLERLMASQNLIV